MDIGIFLKPIPKWQEKTLWVEIKILPDIHFCPVQDVMVTARWLWLGPTEEKPTAGTGGKQMFSQRL